MGLLDMTTPGLAVGGTDVKEIDLTLYGQMVLGAYEELFHLPQLILRKSIRGGKGYRFPIIGRTRPTRFVDGSNMEDADNDAGVPKKYANTYRDVEVDDEPNIARTVIRDTQEAIHMDIDEYLMEVAQDQARQLSEQEDLFLLSVMAQGAAHTNDLTVTGDNVTIQKEAAAQFASLTDGANNSFGYHIDALSTGKAISDALFKFHNYGNFLRWAFARRFALVGTLQFTRLVQDFALPVSYAVPSGGTAVHGVPILSNQIAGADPGASYSQVRVTTHAGFRIYECPWLTGIAGQGLGTFIQTNAGVASPSTTDDKKYQPTTISAGAMPLYKFQKSIQTKLQHGITAPNTWAKFRDWLDKIAIIVGVNNSVGWVDLFDLVAEEGIYKAHLQGTPLQMKKLGGGGILRPEGLGYIATDYHTT